MYYRSNNCKECNTRLYILQYYEMSLSVYNSGDIFMEFYLNSCYLHGKVYVMYPSPTFT